MTPFETILSAVLVLIGIGLIGWLFSKRSYGLPQEYLGFHIEENKK